MIERAGPEVVVIGGGIVGCSVAFHLARRGGCRVRLFERRQLTCGTTWHAAGLLGQLRATPNLTRLARYSTELYAGLEEETGQPTGFRRTGSVTVATRPERLVEIRRQAATARSFGLEAEDVDAQWLARHWPLARHEDVLGAIHLPGDASTDPVDTTRALAAGARQYGAEICEGVEVEDVLQAGGRVRGVRTSEGEFAADIVVLATGMWTHGFARRFGVNVPLHAAEHFYVVTEPVPGIAEVLPTLREPDACTYIKRDPGGRLLVGFFEPRAKPWGGDDIAADFFFDELPEDWEHVAPQLEMALHRLPLLESVGIRKFFNGPEAFTPDDRYYLGEAPDLAGCFVAAGFNSIGILSAGGAGHALADWILDGEPSMDLWDVDIRRALPFQGEPAFLRERTVETPGLLYQMHWPHRQFETARGTWLSPLHDALAAAGACFGEAGGWERPDWFAVRGPREEESPDLPLARMPRYEHSWSRPNWLGNLAHECRAVRARAGLFDQSSFTKLRVVGKDACALLERISANRVDVEPGRVVYTQWLNRHAGIEADLTVTRVSPEEFWVIGGVATSVRDRQWLLAHRLDGEDAVVSDFSREVAVLGLMGPESRGILSELTSADMEEEAFPFGCSRAIELAGVPVRASRLSYVGELGWELYVSCADAPALHAALVRAGGPAGLRYAGFQAMNVLRLEKGFRHWGHDITPDDSPVEAGLSFAVATEGRDFLGREAFLRRREAGPERRLLSFRLREPEGFLFHDEPIWRDGKRVGRITSGAFSPLFGRSVGLGYIEWLPGSRADALATACFEIEAGGRFHNAEGSLRAFGRG